MADLHITSPANARLKGVAALRRRRARTDDGHTVVEGYDELQLALEAGVAPRCLYRCPEMMRTDVDTEPLVDQARSRGADVITLSRAAFDKVAYREGPDGILAVVPLPGCELSAVRPSPGQLVLVGEGIEKPGNLGAMLRTADAAGVAAVIAADPVTDWGNPNVVRASKGTVFSVPVASGSSAQVRSWLAGHRIRLVATTPEATTDHTQVDLTGAVAVAVGAEKTGLTAELLEAAQDRVRIPMTGRVNSLNVATSAAIVIYEAVRQRGPSGSSR